MADERAAGGAGASAQDSHCGGERRSAVGRHAALDPPVPAPRPPASTGPADSMPARFTPRRSGEQHSLFGEILDWMFAPLLLLWPLSVTITYVVAQAIANAPFDRGLADNVELLADQVQRAAGTAPAQSPLPLRDLLSASAAANVHFAVRTARGVLLAGDGDLPLPPSAAADAGRDIAFRTDQIRGTELRIAYKWLAADPSPTEAAPALVQVAETLEARMQLANEIIHGVLVSQFVTLPIAAALVWFGLTRGLLPLKSLQARIRARRPEDLSPIESHTAPEEIAPLLDAFNDLLARLAQNLATQKRFIADAAHQMKTPLAGLRTQAELALRETDTHEIKRSLRQIAASTQRATHLINQLLALARAEHQGADGIAFETVALDALARGCVRDWVPEALSRRIDLGFEIRPAGGTDPIRIEGAPVLLNELLRNLIDNALRHTPPGGDVTVRVAADRAGVVLEVEDTGPGIPAAERQQVFERFYRVLGTGVDGSGLGLAIVREIARQHEAGLRIGDNPRAVEQRWPGVLVSVEFPPAGTRARRAAPAPPAA